MPEVDGKLGEPGSCILVVVPRWSFHMMADFMQVSDPVMHIVAAGVAELFSSSGDESNRNQPQRMNE